MTSDKVSEFENTLCGLHHPSHVCHPPLILWYHRIYVDQKGEKLVLLDYVPSMDQW